MPTRVMAEKGFPRNYHGFSIHQCVNRDHGGVYYTVVNGRNGYHAHASELRTALHICDCYHDRYVLRKNKHYPKHILERAMALDGLKIRKVKPSGFEQAV